MGWFKRATEEVVDAFHGLAEGPAKIKDIYTAIKDTPPTEFYELELAEVLEIWVDEEDLPLITKGPNKDEPDWSKYGWIKARLFYSSAHEGDTRIMKPMDANIKDYPYPGESVIAAQYVLGGEEDFYYTQKMNFHNVVTNNSYPGISKYLTNFTKGTVPDMYKDNLPKITDPNISIRQIDVEEGDIAFNGRFGNSIKLGSNVKKVKKTTKTTWNGNSRITTLTGKVNSPNLIMRVGQGVKETVDYKPVKEDIDLDGASLWMTTDQLVPLTHHGSKITGVNPKFKTDSSGKQIILNSDRIVFNSKKSDTFLYSTRDINLVSKNRIVLEGHDKVYLGTAPEQGKTTGFPSGDVPQIEPVLKGDQTMDLVDKLIDYLIEFSITMQSAKGSVVDFVVPVSGIKEGCMGLEGSLKLLKTRLNDPKSDIVKTG